MNAMTDLLLRLLRRLDPDPHGTRRAGSPGLLRRVGWFAVRYPRAFIRRFVGRS